ncbi:MAG: hypothetical protein ACRDMV_17965 [Streptosporangiales bacterium]
MSDTQSPISSHQQALQSSPRARQFLRVASVGYFIYAVGIIGGFILLFAAAFAAFVVLFT